MICKKLYANNALDNAEICNVESPASCVNNIGIYKYLGIDLDKNLSGDSHINDIVKKISAGLGTIRRVRNLVPRETHYSDL